MGRALHQQGAYQDAHRRWRRNPTGIRADPCATLRHTAIRASRRLGPSYDGARETVVTTQATLRPCPACCRHARVSEPACPFCGVLFDSAFGAGPAPRAPTVRLARAALFALGAGTAALATACPSSRPEGSSSNADGGDDSGAEDSGLGVTFYGSPSGLEPGTTQTIECTNAAACLPGQVCCSTPIEAVLPPYGGGPLDVPIGLAKCQMAPCSTSDAGVVQLCQSSLECVQPGFACSEGICSLPSEAGTAIDGGQGDATSDGASTTDASPEDASPGDTSPRDDAAGQESD